MNSNVDLSQFLGGAPATNSASVVGRNTAAQQDREKLVAPPRRIVSRYLLPMVLLAGFAAVGTYALRGSLVPVVGVSVTMPIPASDSQVAAAATTSAEHPDGTTHATAPHHSTAVETTAAVEQEKPSFQRKSLFQAPGWVEPSPFPIVIPSLRPGTIETVEVIEGQQVTSGAVVARLVDADARLALEMASSTLALKQAKYDAAVSNWENPIGLTEAVATARAKGQQLTAQARRLSDMADLAALEARIGGTLSKSGYEPSLETQRKVTQLSASRNELLETRAEIGLNSATLEAASDRLRLRIEDREAVESARAELTEARVAAATAQLALDRSIIRTPISGTIMRLAVSPGSMVSGEMVDGMTVAQLYQPERLQVRVDVPLSEAAKVRPGLPAEIKAEALPGKVFRGRLVNIVPQFDLQKNVLPVKVAIESPDPALRPEMITRVEFFAEQEINASGPAADSLKPSAPAQATSSAIGIPPKPSASAKPAQTDDAGALLLIPKAVALQSGEDRHRVMIVGPDSIAHSQEVAASPAGDGMLLVKTGLRLTDKLITTPAKVAAGTKVRINGVMADVTH